MANLTVSYAEVKGLPNYCSKRLEITVEADVPKGENPTGIIEITTEYIRKMVRKELER